MIVSKDHILKLIPQRDPFVLIDELIEHNEDKTRSSFYIDQDHYLVENGSLSIYGLTENMAQTAAARSGYAAFISKEEPQLGFIGAISKLTVINLPAVGERIETKVNEVASFGSVSLVKAEVFMHSDLIASCEMKIAINE